MNRIIAISMVKNEADIIESMVRYTLNYADYLLIKEHNSTDDTRKILELLKEEGLALEIYDCDVEGHNQSDVMTELVYKAIKEFNADVVVPLDADEFLISEKGTVNDVRSSLENLDIRGNYDIPWINFCIAEEGIQQDKWLLSRKVKKSNEPNELKKCIIGRKAVEVYKGFLGQGNHHFFIGERKDGFGYMGYQFTNDEWPEDIYLAHFPRRSKMQYASKVMIGWLTNLTNFGKYTYYARNWQKDSYEYIDNEDVSIEKNEKDFLELDLSAYHDICELKYTSSEVKPIKNVFHLAERLALNYTKEIVYSKKNIVTTIAVYDGNFNKFCKTMESIIKQSYPWQEIIVAVTNYKSMDLLISYLEKIGVAMRVCKKNPFDNLDKLINGTYIQFINCGDVISEEKISNQVIFLEQNKEMLAVISNRCDDIERLKEKDCSMIKPPNIVDINQLLFMHNNKQGILDKMISATMFRRSSLKTVKWMQAFWGESINEHDLWKYWLNSDYLENGNIVFLNEAMLMTSIDR